MDRYPVQLTQDGCDVVSTLCSSDEAQASHLRELWLRTFLLLYHLLSGFYLFYFFYFYVLLRTITILINYQKYKETHRRRSSVKFGRSKTFLPENMHEKLTKWPNFTWDLPEKLTKFPNFTWYMPEKINKMPEFYTIFAPDFGGGGGNCPLPPVSYAYDETLFSFCLKCIGLYRYRLLSISISNVMQNYKLSDCF